jgi:hypothetical protein
VSEQSTPPDTFEVDVTESDINAGIVANSDHCPLAIATNRWLLENGFGSFASSVGASTIVVYGNSKSFYYAHNRRFLVMDFDMGVRVSPTRVSMVRKSFYSSNDGY